MKTYTMIKNILLTMLFLCSIHTVFSQFDSTKTISSLNISGSVDGYYRNAFKTLKENSNNFTSFTNSNQQFQLGMASAIIDYTKG